MCQLNIALLTERTWWHHPFCQYFGPFSQSHYMHIQYSMCANKMSLCMDWSPWRWKCLSHEVRKEEQHSQPKCICNASWEMQSFVHIFLFCFLIYVNKPFPSGRLMSLVCSSVCETFSNSALMCWAWRVAKAIELEGKGLKSSAQHSFICIMSDGAPFPTNRISLPLAITNCCFLSKLYNVHV